MTLAYAPRPVDSSEAWLEALRGRRRAWQRTPSPSFTACCFARRASRSAAAAPRSRSSRGEDLDDLALQAADDALVAVLAKLDTYRGASRFTTWAYKFALLEAGVRLRRRAWQGREVVLEPESWPTFADGAAVDRARERGRGAPARAPARRPGGTHAAPARRLRGTCAERGAHRRAGRAPRTTRGALYKTLHDARTKLRRELAASGYMEDS